MPHQDRPDVDATEGLTSAIIVDQEQLGANPRSRAVSRITLGMVAELRSAREETAEEH